MHATSRGPPACRHGASEGTCRQRPDTCVMRRASPLSEEAVRCFRLHTLGRPAGIGCCLAVAGTPDAHDRLPGTFRVLDISHANWNGATLFMYVEGHKPDGGC